MELDKLNFNVIINDEDFNKQIKKMEDEAKRFNTSMSSLLDLKKQAQQWSQKDVENNRRAWQAKVDEERAQEKINKEKIKTEGLQRKINAQIDQATNGYKTQSRILNEIKGAVLGYLSIQSAGRLLTSLVRVTGEFELQRTTLAAMIGDLNSAEQIIAKIQGLAVESPFQFKELTTYAKQLSAFSVPAQELYDTTKMLADISAGLGVGMDRIVLAYGQVRSAAFLRGQEVRQFTEAGIPILNELAKQFSELEGRVVSTNEVFDKISKRLVPFEMVAKVFKDMTSEGGKFYNMQEVQAETLKGKISNLKDAYEVMLNEIGKGQSENLKGVVDWARKLMQNYEEIGRTLMELVVAYGIYKTALMVVTKATDTFTLANHKLLSALDKSVTWISKNPYVALAAGITAVGFAIYKASTRLEDYEKIQKAVSDTQKEYTASVVSETTKLDSLYAKLRVAKKGTDEYAKAKKAIYSQYASYISELKAEGKEVENLAGIYNDLKEKIEASAKAKYRMTASQNIESEYASAMDAFYKRFELLSTNMGNTLKRKLMEVEKEALWQYMLGDETALNIPEAEGIRGIAKDMGPSGYGYLIDKAQKDAKIIIDTYTKAKERIDALFGEEAEVTSDENPFAYNIPDEGAKGKSPAQKAIEEQIKSIEKLKDAYEKLLPYLDEVQMKSTLKSLFPNVGQAVIDSLDFNAELERLANRLEEFDEDAAQRLRDSISKDVAGAIADSFNAVEQYKKMLDSWLGEDFDIVGEGTAFDISKILNNLNNEYAKIDQKRQRALDLLNKAQLGDEIALAKVREVYGEEVWQRYLEKGEEVINELAMKERNAARKTANEKIRDLADKDLKERMQKANINLTEFDDKTLKQVNEMYERLFDLYGDIQTEIETLMEDGVTEDELANLQKLEDMLILLGVLIKDTNEEKLKKMRETLQKTVEAVDTLASSLTDLGGAMGNANFAKFGKELSETSNTFYELIEAFESEDTIAIISNIVSFVISHITDIVSSAYEEQTRLNEAAREYAEIMLNIRREAHSGIFGTDEMGLASENEKIFADAQREYQNALGKFQNDKQWRQENYFNRYTMKDLSVADVVENIANSQGWDLYRKNGELNIEMLMAYYDTYAEHLTKKQLSVVDALISSYEAQNDAASQSAEYMTSLFSQAADNIAESMVNAFIESGNAVTDLRGVVSDVTKQMATDLIKTLYVMPVLNDYAEQLRAIAKDTTLPADEKTVAALNILQTGVDKIKENENAINETLEKLEPFFAMDEEGTKDLGEGIKGITEDQANLLASYLNAIRADVSYSKTLWVRMDANLLRIAEMFTSTPSFMEYQAQIAANTYNTALASQEILSELRGVVTTESGASSIRVYKDN